MLLVNCWGFQSMRLQRCYLKRLKRTSWPRNYLICGCSVTRKEDEIFPQCKYSCSNRALTNEHRNKIPGLFIVKENHKREEVITVFRMDNKDGSGGCCDLNKAWTKMSFKIMCCKLDISKWACCSLYWRLISHFPWVEMNVPRLLQILCEMQSLQWVQGP